MAKKSTWEKRKKKVQKEEYLVLGGKTKRGQGKPSTTSSKSKPKDEAGNDEKKPRTRGPQKSYDKPRSYDKSRSSDGSRSSDKSRSYDKPKFKGRSKTTGTASHLIRLISSRVMEMMEVVIALREKETPISSSVKATERNRTPNSRKTSLLVVLRRRSLRLHRMKCA